MYYQVLQLNKSLNTLLNDKFLDWSKSKAVADNKSNVAEKLKLVSGRVENIEGKGENAGHQHFLLFLQCFPEGFSVGGCQKSGFCCKKLTFNSCFNS